MDTIRTQQLSELRKEVYSLGNSPKARLRALFSIFASWSEDAEKQKLMKEIAVKMDFQDIDQLRNIIHEQVVKLKVINTSNFTEQILFIIIGALKFEIKREAFSKHWVLAESSLDAMLSAASRSKIGVFNAALLSSFLVLAGLITYINLHKPLLPAKVVNLSGNNYLDSTEPMPSPYVPAHFYSLRKEMGKSVCLIPQAATLPAQQRAAFLKFLNTGEIDLDQLTNLQAALSLVHCEYTPLTIRLKH